MMPERGATTEQHETVTESYRLRVWIIICLGSSHIIQQRMRTKQLGANGDAQHV